jgi:hypothetical protein
MDVYTGELTLTKEEYHHQFSRFARSLYIAQSPEAYLFVGLRNISSDGEFAQYYWMVFRHHSEAEIKSGHSNKDWSKEKLLQAARETVEKLEPQFRALIHKTRPEGMIQPPLYSMQLLRSDLFIPSHTLTFSSCSGEILATSRRFWRKTCHVIRRCSP